MNNIKIIYGTNEFVELCGDEVEKPTKFPCVVESTEVGFRVTYCPDNTDFNSFVLGFEIAMGYF